MALIPVDRQTTWTPGTVSGYPGGIPTSYVNTISVTDYGAIGDGVTDDTAAIQAAVTYAGGLGVRTLITFPAGDFRVTGAIGNGLYGYLFTLRGSGRGITNIVYDNDPATHGRCFAFSNGSSFSYPASDNILTAGNTQNSTTITIADATVFSVGQIIRIEWENMEDDTDIEAGATPVLHTYGFDYVRTQVARVTGTTATTISFTPGIIHEPQAGLAARVYLSTFPSEEIGVEDMTITGGDAQPYSLIEFGDAYNCWVSNVETKLAFNYNVVFANGINCEMRKSIVSTRTGGGTNGAGLLMNGGARNLVEDNIFFDLAPCIEWNFSVTGSVFAYNFVNGTANINHGPFNSYNLYEGNIISFIQCDGYFGGAEKDLLYRNWLTGKLYEGTLTPTISLHRFTRNYTVIGNIIGCDTWFDYPSPYSLGNPNIGNSDFTGTAEPSTGDFWAAWKATATLNTRTSDTQGVLTMDNAANTFRTGAFRVFVEISGTKNEVLSDDATYPVASGGSYPPKGPTLTFTLSGGVLPIAGSTLNVFPGPEGWQEKDLDVENTIVRKGNRFISEAVNELIPDEPLGGDPLVDSQFRSSEPDYFGGFPWPPIDPDVSSTADYERQPAAYRYINGDGPPEESTLTCTTLNVTTLTLG